MTLFNDVVEEIIFVDGGPACVPHEAHCDSTLFCLRLVSKKKGPNINISKMIPVSPPSTRLEEMRTDEKQPSRGCSENENGSLYAERQVIEETDRFLFALLHRRDMHELRQLQHQLFPVKVWRESCRRSMLPMANNVAYRLTTNVSFLWHPVH